jgi:hypothetical protein
MRAAEVVADLRSQLRADGRSGFMHQADFFAPDGRSVHQDADAEIAA